jgi:uncharacterized protein involved in tellurium resistance
MKNFNDITIFNKKYIKVKSIKVWVPYLESDRSFEFISKNKQLIHLAIDQSEMRKHMSWGDWERTIRHIFYKEKNILDIDLDCFVDWNIGASNFIILDNRKCSENQIKSFKFLRGDQRSEILNGNENVVLKEYIKALSDVDIEEAHSLIYR